MFCLDGVQTPNWATFCKSSLSGYQTDPLPLIQNGRKLYSAQRWTYNSHSTGQYWACPGVLCPRGRCGRKVTAQLCPAFHSHNLYSARWEDGRACGSCHNGWQLTQNGLFTEIWNRLCCPLSNSHWPRRCSLFWQTPPSKERHQIPNTQYYTDLPTLAQRPTVLIWAAPDYGNGNDYQHNVDTL